MYYSFGFIFFILMLLFAYLALFDYWLFSVLCFIFLILTMYCFDKGLKTVYRNNKSETE